MLLIRNIRLKPSDSEDIIKEKIIKRLHTKTTDFHYTIYKKSILILLTLQKATERQ